MRRSGIMACAVVLAMAVGVSHEAQAVSICLDPGHGGSDPGATGCGLQEAERCLTASLELKNMLVAAGHTVYMTRTTNATVGLSARASYANSKGVTTFASIHNNAFNGSATGIETYCYTNNLGQKSGTQAKNIQSKMIATWPLTNRGAKEANFAVVRETSMPATLSELAFIDNCSKDAKYLASNSELKRAMVAHCEALVQQWGGTASKCSSSGGGGGGGTTTGKIMAGTFNSQIDSSHWLGGVKYVVGGQTQTSAGSYQMMTFNLAPGKYSATASKDGWNTSSKDCGAVTAGGTTWCSIALTPKPAEIKPGTAVGDVKNAADGSSIAGAKVSIKNGATATYDGKTKWSFSVNPGTYQIAASAEGFDDNEISCTVVSDKQTDCTLTLVPKKGTITGVVTDGTQNVASVVRLNDQKVDFDGANAFKFTVDAGTYTLTASAEGYEPGTATCEVKRGGEATCNITVKKEAVVVERGILKGIVKNAESGDVVESDVSADGQTVHFTGNDNFRFFLEPGTYTVSAEASGFDKGARECSVVSGESTQCDIELTPKAGAFAGMVLDAVTKAPIDVSHKPLVTMGEETISVGEDGSWKSSLSLGVIQVTASAEGYHASTVSCTIEPGNEQSPCEIMLVPENAQTGVLQGYVYDSRSETMLIAATVTIEGYNPAQYPGKGKWKLGNLPAGLYNVQAVADGYYEATKVCEVVPSADEKDFSQCNIGLVAKAGGGAVIEADYDMPTTSIQVYSESCAATPISRASQSWFVWAIGLASLALVGLRRRKSKGDLR